MQIELPQDIVDRLHKRAGAGQGVSEVEVIRQALDTLDWRDAQRQAILEGVEAWQAGDVQDFDEFDREFRATNGITE